MKKLATGIQHFPKLIEQGYLYIDKTPFIWQMLNQGEGFFLSRPRRFGKSLFLSTLATFFSGQKKFFKNLFLGSVDYDWPQFPVMWFDFSTVTGRSLEEVKESLQNAIQFVAEDLGLEFELQADPVASFIKLIRQAAKEKNVVILIDEYDQPLLKVIDDEVLRGEVRNQLNDFYTVIKSMNRFIHFSFVTGVSKFSKVSLFSGMNNLKDLSLDSNFATITGFTEQELKQNYREWINETAKKRGESEGFLLDQLRQWYNGYCFAANSTKVYNPVSLNFFFQEARFADFWFGTATPSFAIKLIKKQNFPVVNLEQGVTIGQVLEEHHEIDEPNLIPLLFQTGYLTITGYDEKSRTYTLHFPNEEVRLSFLQHLLASFSRLNESQLGVHFDCLGNALREGDLSLFFSTFNTFLAEIPFNLHVAKEAYYHSLFYLILRSLNLRVEVEKMTSRGRLDLMVAIDHTLYIFEFKINGTAEAALKQINDKEYAKRYCNLGKKIICVGVAFSTESRSITDWESCEFYHQDQ